jgi:hypothetical protein
MDLTARKEAEPVVNGIAWVTVGNNNHPYRHVVTAATHLLFLRFENLSLVVDFVTGVSEHLLVTRAEDTKAVSGDITEELQIDCPRDSNVLHISFQISSKAIVYVTFVWDTISSCAT